MENTSVYQKLKIPQNNIIAANCLAYILHNVTKYATGNLETDVENIVLNVHFSISAFFS